MPSGFLKSIDAICRSISCEWKSKSSAALMISRTVFAKSVSVEFMEYLLYWIARGLIRLLHAMPLVTVARLGRAGGAFAYRLDARHRRVALNNLELCFAGELSQAEIRAIARENFRRIGESYLCALKTAAMTWEQLAQHVEFELAPNLKPGAGGEKPRSVVAAIGHFG